MNSPTNFFECYAPLIEAGTPQRSEEYERKAGQALVGIGKALFVFVFKKVRAYQSRGAQNKMRNIKKVEFDTYHLSGPNLS